MKHFIFFVTLMLLSIVSCNKPSKDFNFYLLDQEIENDPQYGLVKLDSLRKSINRISRHDRMQLELLTYKAEDKCFIPHLSDSLILSIHSYFDEYGDTYENILSNYYMGCTYRDMCEYPISVLWFDKAESIAESSSLLKKDSLLLSAIYGQTAQIYYQIGMYSEAYEKLTKSFELKKMLNQVDYWDYADMGRMAYHCDSISIALKCYQQSAFEILGKSNVVDYLDFLGEQLGFFVMINDSNMASILSNVIITTGDSTKAPNVHSALGDYYKNILHDNENALKHYRIALGEESENNRKAEFCKQISLLLYENGENKEALNYAVKHYELMDSAIIELKRTETKTAHSRRHIEEIKEARMFKKEAKYHDQMGIAIFVSCVSMFLTILFAILYTNYKRKLKYLNNMQIVSIENNLLKEKHNKLEQEVHADRLLRSESAQDVTAVIKQLNKISESITEKLQEDSWEIVFNTVDKLYPNFRNRILSCNNSMENKDLIFIYLMKLGYKQADISRITKRARSVISRKYHRIEGLLGLQLIELLKMDDAVNNSGENAVLTEQTRQEENSF